MGFIKRNSSGQSELIEGAVDDKTLEMLRGLRRHTSFDEVTDQA
jgi:hypothetical protein